MALPVSVNLSRRSTANSGVEVIFMLPNATAPNKRHGRNASAVARNHNGSSPSADSANASSTPWVVCLRNAFSLISRT